MKALLQGFQWVDSVLTYWPCSSPPPPILYKEVINMYEVEDPNADQDNREGLNKGTFL